MHTVHLKEDGIEIIDRVRYHRKTRRPVLALTEAGAVEARAVGVDDAHRVTHLFTSGLFFSRRKNTSMSPDFDHDGLKSQCPLVIDFVSGIPSAYRWIPPFL